MNAADMLSPNVYVGPSIVIPIIHNLYLNPRLASELVFIAENSEPKLTPSIEPCFFVYQSIGAFCM
jgi:hypothetical protein